MDKLNMAGPLYILIRVDGDTNHQFEVNDTEIVIGRGQLLQISEKKISRNHALLTYESKEKLRLKSTHANPCFVTLTWRSKKILLKCGGSVSLNTGDQFSLLNGEYSYKVVIKDGLITENNNEKEFGDSDVLSSLAVMCKENESMHTSAESGKKSKRKLPSWMSPSGSVKKQPISKTPKLQPESEDLSIENPTKKKKGNLSENDDIISTGTMPKLNLCGSSSDEDDTLIHVFRKRSQNNTKCQSSSTKGSYNNFVLESPKKSENDDNEVVPENDNNEVIPENDDNEVIPENDNNEVIPKNDDNEVIPENDNNISSKITRPMENNEPISIKHNDESQRSANANISSSSPTTNSANINSHSAKRTPCMYGVSCYRKNTVHFQEFSHPSDPDYYVISSQDSDHSDDSDKPECEYGLNCYRKNSLHRKEYKHTRRINSNRSSKNKKEVDEEEDEYDLEDSFIDSNEEEIMTDEELDWEPTEDARGKFKNNNEESESDVEDLLQDAKNFAKNKKLWQK